MGKIIGVVNQKGGAGKSSITNALSHEFARRGYRVLVVDYDPQGTQTMLFGFNKLSQFIDTEHDITNIFNNEDINPINVKENLYLIPANQSLREEAESGRMGKELVLSNFLRGGFGKKGIAEEFDLIFIDSPADSGALTVGTIAASDYILIPTRLTFVDSTGLVGTLQTIIQAVITFRLELSILGFIPVAYKSRLKEHNDVLSSLKQTIPQILEKHSFIKKASDELFLEPIRDRIAWAEAAAKRVSIREYIEKEKRAQKDIIFSIENLTDEITRRVLLPAEINV
ncbi:chromosome partitioning protein [Persephonella hydrogeniphila]|uniref:Chromosome partitioning protein n=1 Tax=Persephonella hydrogeniphila TaxID=198703 RepID=A0A285N1N8_9AQUI|nr:ParA family protein [Persephonella hydrogeniphila]SNZ02833.1 chromosome partitioning protein [Persephonella hydrogeniphila]